MAASFAHDAPDADQPTANAATTKKAGANRERLIILVSAVGVAVAFLTLRRSGKSPAAPSGPVPVPTSQGMVVGSGGGGGQSADLGSYLQNLTQQMAASNTALQSSLSHLQTSALPAPFVPTFDPTDTHTVRNAGTGEIFQVQSGGLLHLSQAEYAALGQPANPSQWIGPAAKSRYTPYESANTPAATTSP